VLGRELLDEALEPLFRIVRRRYRRRLRRSHATNMQHRVAVRTPVLAVGEP